MHGAPEHNNEHVATVRTNVNEQHYAKLSTASTSLPHVGGIGLLVDKIEHLNTAGIIGQNWTLNNEQLQAFEIITNLCNNHPSEPLKMLISGAAGTGKS